MRVLVVDDEPLVRWALAVGLAGAGFDTVAAATAAEARQLAAQWPRPDVVLLDLHLTDWSVLFVDLRAIAPGARLLALGTRGSVFDSLDASLEVIAKPFDLADVVERVRRVAGSPVLVS